MEFWLIIGISIVAVLFAPILCEQCFQAVAEMQAIS